MPYNKYESCLIIYIYIYIYIYIPDWIKNEYQKLSPLPINVTGKNE